MREKNFPNFERITNAYRFGRKERRMHWNIGKSVYSKKNPELSPIMATLEACVSM